ncbi:hypothetical protein DPMN_023526 [Dreissena polymorpha]|uniref:Uncharacterized protein n=1 Tax=Dreissena polymorpha TaxID=45954 RepID=A0A9D4LME6_DREPO|nr:hypothetical protein DPMN_023526 [Dreissena polymorpha]
MQSGEVPYLPLISHLLLIGHLQCRGHLGILLLLLDHLLLHVVLVLLRGEARLCWAVELGGQGHTCACGIKTWGLL